MKKTLFAFITLFTLLGFAYAQNSGSIDSDLLSESENSSYSYTEWTGGYSPEEINTANQIKDIGRRLANGIKYQESVQGESLPYNKGNPAYKYSAARIYNTTKRGADVILIGESATVDTIKCLSMIIQGYLENAYNFTSSDASRMAKTICYWNTKLYNNNYLLNDFEDGVKEVFQDYSTKVGLSPSYKDWKKSVILIPHIFTKVEITESPVTESLEEEIEESPALDNSYNYSYEEEESPAEIEEEVEKPAYNNSYKNANNKKKNSNKNLYILAGVAGGVLILGIIIVILVLKKKEEI